jgi:spore coat protein U-like protein
MHKAISNYRSGWMAAVITVGLILATASVTLAAETHAASITIQGTVLAVNTISITPESGYNTLDLTATRAVADTLVATVNEKNNCATGYTVTLVSQNADGGQARLKGNNSTIKYINYSMKYGPAGSEAAVTLDSKTGTVTSTTGASTGAGNNKQLLVTIAGNPRQEAGVYSDTLTLTIAAK